MKLTIEIASSTGEEMEINFNRAIEDFEAVLLKKGYAPMELIAYSEDIRKDPIYKITLE